MIREAEQRKWYYLDMLLGCRRFWLAFYAYLTWGAVNAGLYPAREQNICIGCGSRGRRRLKVLKIFHLCQTCAAYANQCVEHKRALTDEYYRRILDRLPKVLTVMICEYCSHE